MPCSPPTSASRFARRLLSRYSRGAVEAALAATDPANRPPAEVAMERLRADPCHPMRAAGLTPDPWQEEMVRCPARQIAALCTRRSGKSRTTASRVLTRSLLRKRYKTLIFAPTEEQSKELLDYVREMNDAVGSPVPVVRESLTEIAWANGSRVRVKTDRPKSSRGFTPDLIVIDEAAQVSDVLYMSVQPMMVLGKAELMALTTPFGKLGWFYEAWTDDEKRRYWRTFTVTADQCPRISTTVLDEHRRTMPQRWFDQEYNCQFNDVENAVFPLDVIHGGRGDGIRPLFAA